MLFSEALEPLTQFSTKKQEKMLCVFLSEAYQPLVL